MHSGQSEGRSSLANRWRQGKLDSIDKLYGQLLDAENNLLTQLKLKSLPDEETFINRFRNDYFPRLMDLQAAIPHITDLLNNYISACDSLYHEIEFVVEIKRANLEKLQHSVTIIIEQINQFVEQATNLSAHYGQYKALYSSIEELHTTISNEIKFPMTNILREIDPDNQRYIDILSKLKTHSVELFSRIAMQLLSKDLSNLSLVNSSFNHFCRDFVNKYWQTQLQSRFPFATTMKRYENDSDGNYKTLKTLKKLIDKCSFQTTHTKVGKEKRREVKFEAIKLPFAQLYWLLIEERNVDQALEFIKNDPLLKMIDVLILLTRVYGRDEKNLLHRLVEEKYQDALNKLYEYALTTLNKSEEGYQGITLAVLFNQVDKIDGLVASGIDVNESIYRWYGLNALHIAAMYGYDECLDKLMTLGASGKNKVAHYGSPLVLAVRFGHQSTVKKLLDYTVDINLKASYSTFRTYSRVETPLSMAVQTESLALVKSFVERGANLNCTTCGSFGLNVHLLSAYNYRELDQNQLEIIEYLLAQGANPRQKPAGYYGGNAISDAIDTNNIKCLKLFLKYSKNIDDTLKLSKPLKYSGESTNKLATLVFLLAFVTNKVASDQNLASITIENIDEDSEKKALAEELDALLLAGANPDFLNKIFKFADDCPIKNKLKIAEIFISLTSHDLLTAEEIRKGLMEAGEIDLDFAVTMYQHLLNDRRIFPVAIERVEAIKTQLYRIAKETLDDKLNSLLAMHLYEISLEDDAARAKSLLRCLRELEQLDPNNQTVDDLKLQAYYTLIFGNGIATSWDEIRKDPVANAKYEDIRDHYLLKSCTMLPLFIEFGARTSSLKAKTNSQKAQDNNKDISQTSTTSNKEKEKEEDSSFRPGFNG